MMMFRKEEEAEPLIQRLAASLAHELAPKGDAPGQRCHPTLWGMLRHRARVCGVPRCLGATAFGTDFRCKIDEI